MSAYMMSEKALAKITMYLYHKIKNSNYPYGWVKVIRESCEDYEKKNCKIVNLGTITPETLYRILELMNAESLNQRYDDKIKDNISKVVPAMLSDNSFDFDKVQMLKTIQCYKYQCCEGNIPETELYKALDIIEGELCYEIVSYMPEYIAAEWD